MTKKFKDLEINDDLVRGLSNLGIESPTPIQEKVIPVILEGKSVLAKSETGTGKTLAYLLPILQMINKDEKLNQCIILSPTHELTAQINNVLRDVVKESGVKISSATLIGGANIKRQIDKLKEKPQVIVGSPGRILELISKKKIDHTNIKTMVFDEGDKLLDVNNIRTIHNILKYTINAKQMLLFSATAAKETESEFKKICTTFDKVSVKSENTVNTNIEHCYFVCENRDKVETLRKLIHATKAKKSLVFINRGYDVNMTLSKLRFNKISADSICGNSFKENRKKAIDDFRNGNIDVLVSSDISARGLDVKGVTHVFNLDLPEDNLDYLHRAGRCGRAGENGCSYSIVTKNQIEKVRSIEKEFKINISEKVVYEGDIKDEIPFKPKKKVKKDKYAHLKEKAKKEALEAKKREQELKKQEEKSSDRSDRYSDRNDRYSRDRRDSGRYSSDDRRGHSSDDRRGSWNRQKPDGRRSYSDDRPSFDNRRKDWNRDESDNRRYSSDDRRKTYNDKSEFADRRKSYSNKNNSLERNSSWDNKKTDERRSSSWDNKKTDERRSSSGRPSFSGKSKSFDGRHKSSQGRYSEKRK